MSINTLTPVENWPDRKLPQERFDEKVQIAMGQISNMIGELNTNIIPTLNTIPEINESLSELTQKLADVESLMTTKASNSIMVGSTSTSQGVSGLVPPPLVEKIINI